MAAEDQREKIAPATFSGLLAVVVLAAGAIWINLPLEPLRPTPSGAGIRLNGGQQVDARLWQDPFGVVAKSRGSQSHNDVIQVEVEAKKGLVVKRGPGASSRSVQPDPSVLAALIKKKVSDNKAKGRDPLIVLGVMVFGDASVGADEYRRRTRYAVVSALMSAGFTPEDSERICYVNVGLGRGYPEVVPYEWFYQHLSPLLVLWLDESALLQPINPAASSSDPLPLARLEKLLDLVTPDVSEDIRLGFIGPAGTDVLIGMAEELGRLRDEPSGKLAKTAARMGFFSPFATVSADVLLQRFLFFGNPSKDPDLYRCQYGPGECDPEALFRANGDGRPGLRTFLRTTPSDADVVSLLFEELRHRGLRQDDPIAVIGEWDTAYARELNTLIRRTHRPDPPLTPDAESVPDKVSPQTVHSFGYMRGLDGRLPEPEKKAEGKPPAEKPRDRVQIERPEGDAQVDYLRRLAGLMKAREDQLSKQTRRPVRFRAIGIVGNDYYDKLLVLQALRPVFPEALFFTTDLYSAMLHPTDNAFTRNVLVGSGFGLTLHPKLQQGTPPFRDSYQSAAYFATKVALDGDGRRERLAHWREKTWLTPVVWEIGRTRFFEMRPSTNDERCWSALDCHWVHDLSDRHTGFRWWELAWVAAAVPLVLCVLFPRLRHALWVLSQRWWFFVVIVPVLIGVMFFLVLPAYIDATTWTGEPFAWFEGVSIWPSNLLRLIALLVAIGGLLYTFDRVRTLVVDCEDEFFRKRAAASRASQHRSKLEERIRKQYARLKLEGSAALDWLISSLPCWKEKRPGAQPPAFICALRKAYLRAKTWRYRLSPDCVNARYAWRKHRQSLRGTRLFLWAIMELACLAFLFWSILHLGGAEMSSPSRSPLSHDLNDTLVKAAVIVTQFLLVCVALILRRTNGLARKLSSTTPWPDAIRVRKGLPTGTALPSTNGQAVFDEWLNLSLIARQSEAINALVYFPFVALLLVALARFRIFDNWSMPAPLAIVIGFSFVYLILSALRVRLTAEQMRSSALRRLEEKLIFLQGREEQQATHLAAQCKLLIEQVQKLSRGAFMPIRQQPVVRGLLGLVGGVSGAALLEYAALANF